MDTPLLQPRVLISILNWNRWQETLRCLESLRRVQYSNYLVVVGDNGSQDDSVEKIKAWAVANLGCECGFAEYRRSTALDGGEEQSEQALDGAPDSPRFVLIRNEANLGFTGGNNVSIRYALTRKHPADFVMLLNNDAVVAPGCLSCLVEVIEKTKAGIAEAVILNEAGSAAEPPWIPPRWQIAVERFLGEKTEPFLAGTDFQEVSATHGAAMLMRSAMLRAVFSIHGEYLHERFFMYLEDVGISVRSRKLGYRCMRANNAVVWHRGASSAGGKYNCLEYYYGHRNALLLSRELSRGGKLIVRALNFPRILGRIVKSLVYRRYAAAHAIFFGVLAGCCGVGGKWKKHDDWRPHGVTVQECSPSADRNPAVSQGH